MIDLRTEKACKISYAETYKIISNSIDIANENGFLNSANFERSLYMFTAAALYEDVDREEILKNPLAAWDNLVEAGAMDKLLEEYPSDLQRINDIGQHWFNEYESYLHSIRGAFGDVQNFMAEMNENLIGQLQGDKAKDIVDALQLADDWGMNRA